MTIEHAYIVIAPHVSEFPEPLVLKTGDRVSVGEVCDGPEGWPDWYLCSAPGQEAGFVPGQILARHGDGTASLREDFTNKELDVVPGEILHGGRQQNGWVWATRLSGGAAGWVPLENVRVRAHEA